MTTIALTIPFDLDRALNGAKLVTRDGRAVMEFRRSRPESCNYPFDAKIDGKWHSYTRRGTVWIGRPDPLDLVMEGACG